MILECRFFVRLYCVVSLTLLFSLENVLSYCCIRGGNDSFATAGAVAKILVRFRFGDLVKENLGKLSNVNSFLKSVVLFAAHPVTINDSTVPVQSSK